jgi:hypothetical protein
VSFEQGCPSTTDGAETVVAGRQSARPPEDIWGEVDCLGQPTAQERAVQGLTAASKALMFPSLLRHPYCQCRQSA